MVRVLGVDLGFTPESRLTMRVQLPRGQTFPSRSRDFVERVISAAARVPGVANAGASEGVPLGNTLYAGHYRVEGFPQGWMRQGMPTTGACCTQSQWVSSDYFQAAGIQIVRGRAFTATDAAAAPAVALISERLARKFPAGMEPIGHYLTAGEEGEKTSSDRRLIVGVVRDVRDMSLEREALQAIYLPIEERGAAMMTLVLRTTVDPLAIAGAVQKAVQSHAGPVIISDVLTFTDVMKRSVGSRTYAGVCLVLVSAAIVAAGLPARRASRVDPLIAMRAE